jgi:plastocyanin
MRMLSCVQLAAFVGAMVVTGFAGNRAMAADDKWATVKGQVVWAGPAIPERPALNVNKNQAECLAKGPVLGEEIVVNKSNKGMANVFVWITTANDAKPPIAPALMAIDKKSVDLDQPMCAFIPHAIAVREGQDVIMKNTSQISHNVNWSGGAKNPGDNKIIPAGKNLTMTPKLKASKQVVGVTCNIHGWMRGWIRVFDHPYYAVTDEDGKFEIKDAPVGAFKIWYWTDSGWKDGSNGANGFPITIKAGGTDLGQVQWKPAK